MSKSSSKKRERADDDTAENHDAKPILKKSKLDSNGRADVTKKNTKVKEAKAEPVPVDEGEKPKREKKDKKEKKEKKGDGKKDKKAKKPKDEESTAELDKPAPAEPPATEEATNGDASADKKSKKDKKKAKKDKKDKPKPAAEAQDEAQPEADASADGETPTTASDKQNRFIVFVGNLPFTATADAVRAHFATLQPTSVRLLTQRENPAKSRGIAFVEFAGYDHMKTCLKKFHHTEFDDGKAQPRKINVELTAGGGGKTAARQDKIKQKNAKLNEERAQRMKREEEAKYEKAMKTGQTQEQREEDAVHPSRRARVPYGRH
ncbi:hypothetical protein C8A05DRAFT_29550 [Staphylotrichum tortipilum]|uniref:RRM domain-containing protein n=1 Tax=Staphylotrichum tortipilum TaxID=2831512 RepID=A0AAN6MU91_9PEZI|nr:hypothetical protein C8A05DRAFT_29550 [Staphylotrichum longicolle]